MRWCIENLEITAERWKEMWLEGFANPIKLSCEDHERGGSAFIQQWDGDSWEIASDWILPNRTELRPAYEPSSAQSAKETAITPRACNLAAAAEQSGRESWREGACQHVYISVVTLALK